MELNRRDYGLEYLVTRLKRIKNSYLRDICVRYSLIVIAVLIFAYVLIQFWKKKSILLREYSKYLLVALSFFIIGLYFGDIEKVEIQGVAISRKNISEIIPVEMTGVKKVELGRLIK